MVSYRWFARDMLVELNNMAVSSLFKFQVIHGKPSTELGKVK